MSAFEYMRINREDSVTILTIDHPPANALSQKVMEELEKSVLEFEADSTAKVLMITGAGNFAFVAGADIRELIKIDSASKAEELALRGQEILSKIENLSKPVMAVINAVCLGGGNELAMACHLRIASDRARFGQPEINLGIIPGFGGTQRLARICGPSKAFELNVTGDLIPASEALRIGLVNRVVRDEELMKEALGLAKKIASKGPKAVSLILDAIRKGIQMPLDQGLAYEAKLFGKVCETRDMREGLMAFIEKRQPQFTGQ
ncbi:MAG: enoyl-CoA hydratase/isomerase family protein [Candidatus Omnitrophica bacterium]|nr:enoyl-CoA hydratase/isomerase family protein [Candidatus Omnitrophota bacterium]